MTDQSLFESIRQERDGNEFWSARDLMKALEYTKWDKFQRVIQKAREACEHSGQNVADHVLQVEKMITAGKGARKTINDYHLSRYACYLIVQNADPSKPIVALGQTYFAVQTRKQELHDLALTDEERLRLDYRAQLTGYQDELATAARVAGVTTPDAFAIFQDHGYMGLYGGERAADIHRRKALRAEQDVADHMGSDELAANIFRASQTKLKLQREQISTQDAANVAHRHVGEVVRDTIRQLGGDPPEVLPTPTESISQLKQREQGQLPAGEPAKRDA